MISIVEVIVAAIQDKLNIGRVNATLLVCIPMGIISTLLFGTTTGLPVLDVLDKFVNTYGIVAVGFVYVLAIVALRKLPELRNHLNALSSVRVGAIWTACVIFTVVMLGYMLYQDTSGLLKENYSNYPDGFLNIFGWGMSVGLFVFLSFCRCCLGSMVKTSTSKTNTNMNKEIKNEYHSHHHDDYRTRRHLGRIHPFRMAAA